MSERHTRGGQVVKGHAGQARVDVNVLLPPIERTELLPDLGNMPWHVEVTRKLIFCFVCKVFIGEGGQDVVKLVGGGCLLRGSAKRTHQMSSGAPFFVVALTVPVVPSLPGHKSTPKCLA